MCDGGALRQQENLHAKMVDTFTVRAYTVRGRFQVEASKARRWRWVLR